MKRDPAIVQMMQQAAVEKIGLERVSEMSITMEKAGVLYSLRYSFEVTEVESGAPVSDEVEE